MDLEYSAESIITFGHIDNRGIIRPSALFDLMQDVATDHALELSIDKDTLGVFWVLSRASVVQNRVIYPQEKLTVKTKAEGVKGVTFIRTFTITDEKQEVVATAVTTWVMLNAETKSIIRPNSVKAIAEYGKASRDIILPDKLSCDELQPHHIHIVRYSDLDVNGHLNNVKTVDIISDGLDLHSRENLFVSQIQMNYTAECKCGDNIQLSVFETNENGCYVFGQTQEQIKFEAFVKFSEY